MSECRVVTSDSVIGLISEVKQLLADGWAVDGVSTYDDDTALYSQQVVK